MALIYELHWKTQEGARFKESCKEKNKEQVSKREKEREQWSKHQEKKTSAENNTAWIKTRGWSDFYFWSTGIFEVWIGFKD